MLKRLIQATTTDNERGNLSPGKIKAIIKKLFPGPDQYIIPPQNHLVCPRDGTPLPCCEKFVCNKHIRK